jgi:ankyrin repeat protein
MRYTIFVLSVAFGTEPAVDSPAGLTAIPSISTLPATAEQISMRKVIPNIPPLNSLRCELLARIQHDQLTEADLLNLLQLMGKDKLDFSIEYPIENDEFEFYESTPLLTAVMSGNLRIVRLLLKHGADIKFRDLDLISIAAALAFERVNLVKTLVEAGSDVLKQSDNLGGESNWTPLHYAIKYRHLEIVKYLLSLPTAIENMNIGDEELPIHVAADDEDPEFVDILIKAGSPINAQDAFGRN